MRKVQPINRIVRPYGAVHVAKVEKWESVKDAF
jgi:hypothetical protein